MSLIWVVKILLSGLRLVSTVQTTGTSDQIAKMIRTVWVSRLRRRGIFIVRSSRLSGHATVDAAEHQHRVRRRDGVLAEGEPVVRVRDEDVRLAAGTTSGDEEDHHEDVEGPD